MTDTPITTPAMARIRATVRQFWGRWQIAIVWIVLPSLSIASWWGVYLALRAIVRWVW